MDYVLPYVDGSDPVWREQYRQTFNSTRMDESRFRSFGTLRYALRSVGVNLPFVDRVVLIVSTESQVPEWVNRDTVRVVLHDEFMPESHRPTFSSSAIESDMWRIDGLSERFLYANDDLFTMQPMTEDDFFFDGLPRLRFGESDNRIHRNIYRRSCRNGMDMVADALGVDRTDPNLLLKPQHCTKGILTRHMKEVGRLCSDSIEQTITPMRHQSNVTGFVYHYYAMYTGEYAPFEASMKFIKVQNDLTELVRFIREPSASILCMNDAGDINPAFYRDISKAVCAAFEQKFPERSRYESF